MENLVDFVLKMANTAILAGRFRSGMTRLRIVYAEKEGWHANLPFWKLVGALEGEVARGCFRNHWGLVNHASMGNSYFLDGLAINLFSDWSLENIFGARDVLTSMAMTFGSSVRASLKTP